MFMGIKLLVSIFVIFFLASLSFSQSAVNPCLSNAYGTPTATHITIAQDLCIKTLQFRSFLGVSIMIMAIIAALAYVVGQVGGVELRARAVLLVNNIIVALIIISVVYLLLPSIAEAAINTTFGLGYHIKLAQLMLVALFFGVAWVMLFYLPGVLLQHPPLQAAAKEELGALVMSVLILIGWAMTQQLFNDLSIAIITSSVPSLPSAPPQFGYVTSHIDLAQGALNIFFVKLRTAYTQLYLFEVLIGFLSTVSFPLFSPLPAITIISFSFMPFDGLVLLVDAHTMVVETIGYLMATMWAKEFLLIFARDAVTTILLPFGLLVRAFPWFRVTGSSIIALSVVLYFVYPLTLIFSNYLIFDIYKPADFTYAPDVNAVSPFPTQQGVSSPGDIAREYEQARDSAYTSFLEEYESENDVIRRASADPQNTECNSFLARIVCAPIQLIKLGINAAAQFIHTVAHIGEIIFKFVTEDAFNAIFYGTNPVGVAGGLYKFIIHELIHMSQFVVLIIVTSVVEIIISVTMYRNIAELIGGEVEIAGLSKLV